MLVGLGELLEGHEIKAVEESPDVAESGELAPEAGGDTEERVCGVQMNDRIDRLGRGFDGHRLAGGSRKGFMICEVGSIQLVSSKALVLEHD